jgi:hypothetical protein
MEISEAKRLAVDIVSDQETVYGLASLLLDVQLYCHAMSLAANKWPEVNEARLALALLGVHSSVSKACAGLKGAPDTDLPQHALTAMGIADALIGLLDVAGASGMNVADALAEKLRYNAKKIT